jgi:hypothetical protein
MIDTENLEMEAQEYQEFIETRFSEEIGPVVDRGNELSVIISRTGKMLADAKKHKDAAMKSAVMMQLKKIGLGLDIPATTLNELIKSSCENENYLVNWIDRIHRSATHQLEWCRTLVSKAKEEMKYTSGINE